MVATPSPESVADRARRVVRASGLTQREFAERIGMDATALSKALRGSRRLSHDELRTIAATGRVPLRYLTLDDGAPPSRLLRAEQRTGRPRAEQLDAEARRRQVLAATARLIARRGVDDVRVADIAEACGISAGTLHYHFSSKDDALRQALSFYADRLHEALDDAFAGASDPRERFRRLIDIQLPASPDDVDEWSIWVQSWTQAMFHPELRETQLAAYERWRGVVLDLLLECRAAGHLTGGDPELLAGRFTAMVDGLAIQVLASTSSMTVARMRELLLDAFEPWLSLRGR